MKKIVLVSLLSLSTIAIAEDKFLNYQFNDNVIITVSNVPCPLKTLTKDYPFAVVASRKDGQRLFGCYTHDKDDIVIQWAGGDKTVLPANAFLMKPDT